MDFVPVLQLATMASIRLLLCLNVFVNVLGLTVLGVIMEINLLLCIVNNTVTKRKRLSKNVNVFQICRSIKYIGHHVSSYKNYPQKFAHP